jgi:hypothetical protein
VQEQQRLALTKGKNLDAAVIDVDLLPLRAQG